MTCLLLVLILYNIIFKSNQEIIMYFISKTINNGYGETVKDFEHKNVSLDTIKGVWLGGDDIDDIMEESGFTWNCVNIEEGQSLLTRLVENGIVCEEYEDSIVCVSDNYLKAVEAVLKQV